MKAMRCRRSPAPAPVDGTGWLQRLVNGARSAARRLRQQEHCQDSCRSQVEGIATFREQDPQSFVVTREAQVRKEVASDLLAWKCTASALPWQHVVIFRKK
jgi:hypothetical protein